MIQLKYNDTFNSIMEDIHYWTNDTIPDNIISFIKNISNSKIIYEGETNTYYCPKCFSKLRRNEYCPKCHKKPRNSFDDTIFITNIRDITSDDNEYYYYVFDVVNTKVFLYELKESLTIYYNNYPIKKRKIAINKIFLIQKDSLLDINQNKTYPYSAFQTEYDAINHCFEIDNLAAIDNFHTEITDYILNRRGYLYQDNLPLLKDTIYKYTFIWDSIKYLKNNTINLYEITVFPLTNPNFEYLIKYKLYSLAYCNNLEFKNNFSDTFGISKEYLPFMVKHDINIDELSLLRIIKQKNIKLIKKLFPYTHAITKLHDNYHLNILKIIAYFDNKKLKYTYLNDYFDYIKICHELGINLKDKKFLFPNNFIETHNEIVNQYEVIINKDLDKKIKEVGKILQVNKYEDNEYIIFPANSLKSLLEEGFNQNNCVRTYAKNYSEGECQIYFMRKKNNLHKSLVTIEIVNNKVIQARTKNNLLPNRELANIIFKWEKQLIPIVTKTSEKNI